MPESPTMRLITRAQFWGGAALALIAAGFSAALFLGRYAEASDLAKLTDRVEAHSVAEERRVSNLEVALARVEEDFHFIRDQVQEIARSTRSRVLVAPNHKERP